MYEGFAREERRTPAKVSFCLYSSVERFDECYLLFSSSINFDILFLLYLLPLQLATAKLHIFFDIRKFFLL